MKLSGLARVVKNRLYLEIAQNESGAQFLSIGCAVYPLDGFPYVNDKYELSAMLGIPKYKLDDKYTYGEKTIIDHDLYGYDISDCTEEEVMVKRWPMEISYKEKTMEPWVSPDGELDMVDPELLAPIMDEVNNGEYIGFFRRKSANGQNYYVVKSGLYLRALIMPTRVKKDLIDKLKQIVQTIPEKNIVEGKE